MPDNNSKKKKVYSIDEMGVFSGFRGSKLFCSPPDKTFTNAFATWTSSEEGQRHVEQTLAAWQLTIGGPAFLELMKTYFVEDAMAKLQVVRNNLHFIKKTWTRLP